jgi:hypothetical protein
MRELVFGAVLWKKEKEIRRRSAEEEKTSDGGNNALATTVAVSPPPMMTVEPFCAASTAASSASFEPLAKFSNSKTPGGPFLLKQRAYTISARSAGLSLRD